MAIGGIDERDRDRCGYHYYILDGYYRLIDILSFSLEFSCDLKLSEWQLDSSSKMEFYLSLIDIAHTQLYLYDDVDQLNIDDKNIEVNCS